MHLKINRAKTTVKENVREAVMKTGYIATKEEEFYWRDSVLAGSKQFLGGVLLVLHPNSFRTFIHSFNVLAGAMKGTHSSCEICEKLVGTTTDNGSNFIFLCICRTWK